MARNKFPGVCYTCNKWVPPGYGHFERYQGGWRVKCVECASGRKLAPNDKGVYWAQRAYKEHQEAQQQKEEEYFYV